MKFKVLLLLWALLSVTLEISAQATLSMQGTIRNSTGSAVPDGNYSLTFRLYTAESGGTPVWTETQSNIRVTGGVYSAFLGATNPLNAAFNVPYYVGVSVDGGSEMIPRFRLTSAPYALSLIGQGNSFPSSGTVGVGTASPDPSFTLQVGNNTDEGKQMITAPAGKRSVLWLRSGSGVAAVENSNSVFSVNGGSYPVSLMGDGGVERLRTTSSGVNIPGNLSVGGNLSITGGFTLPNLTDITVNNVKSAAGTDLKLYRGTDPHITCGGSSTTLHKQVYIGGSTSMLLSAAHYAMYPPGAVTWIGTGGTSYDIGLFVEQRIRTSGIHIYSDARIKKDVFSSNSRNDLSTLMALRVVDYKYIDPLKSGLGPNKGFIAQEVEKVYPTAVRTTTDVVPDVFAPALNCSVSGDEATFTIEKAHSLSTGDRVRILLESKQEIFDVVRVDGDNSFTVSGWSEKGEPGLHFVYGKEVRDFKEVDYDRIHNLNVSATQELARQVEQLRAENAELRRLYTNVQLQNDSVNGRLAKLEAMLNTGNSKR